MTVCDYTRPEGRTITDVLEAFGPERIQSMGPKALMAFGGPDQDLPDEVNQWRISNLPNLFEGMARIGMGYLVGVPMMYGALYLRKKTAEGDIIDYGLASLLKVTDSGATYIRNSFLGTVEPESMRYHAFGTSSTAENVNQNGCITELTTRYLIANLRPTGTLESVGNFVYRTVANLLCSGSGEVLITEHCLMSDGDVGQGTGYDRSQFTARPVLGSAPESLETTYDGTFTSGL